MAGLTQCGFCVEGVIERDDRGEVCPYCEGTGFAPQDEADE